MNGVKGKNKIVLLNIASTIILQGLAFVSGPIFSSALGTNNYGVASVYLTWVQLASTVFSLQAAGTIAQARVYYPQNEQQKYQSSVLFLATCSYVVFSALTLIIMAVISIWMHVDFLMIVVGLLHGWGLYVVTAMNGKFTYEFKANWNFILSVVISILSISLSLLFIRMIPQEENYWGRIIGQASVYAIAGVVLIVYMIRSGRTFFNKNYWKFSLPIAVPTVFHLLANIVLNQSDKVMLKGMDSSSAAGIYALACTFSLVLNAIWTALNNSWVPFYYEYTKKKQIEIMKKHANNYLELFTIVTMGFILLSKEVFHIYANTSFWEGTDLIPIFSLGCYFIFLYSFPVNYEFYHKKTKTIAIGTTLAALCNIVLNIGMIYMCGIQGAVIATAISHFLQFVFHFVCAKKIGEDDFPFRIVMFIPGICVVCGTCLLYWITKELWFVRWGIALVLGIYIVIKMIKRKEIF